jgi:BMFP domain-containing protein YqiC
MQTQNRLFDDVARVAGGALGALTGVRDEIEGIIRHRLERTLSEMDLVPRDEFEAVKAMAAEARAENEHLAARIEELEEALKRRASGASASSATQGRRQATRRAGAAAGTSAAARKAGVDPEGEVDDAGDDDGADDTQA